MAEPLGGRAARKARTRAAILAAARDRFVSAGYEGTTIRDIAAAAGVGIGTVHAHFHDKRALLLACFDEQISDAVALGLDTLPAEGALLDQLLHLAGVLYAAYARHPALSREMVRATLFPDSPAPDGLLLEFLGELAALFQAALADGTLSRLPEGGALAAQGFFSAYFLVLVGGLAGQFGPDPEGWLLALRRLLAAQLVGLGADPGLLHPQPAEDS